MYYYAYSCCAYLIYMPASYDEDQAPLREMQKVMKYKPLIQRRRDPGGNINLFVKHRQQGIKPPYDEEYVPAKRNTLLSRSAKYHQYKRLHRMRREIEGSQPFRARQKSTT